MRRRWTIGVGIAVALLALLVANALIVRGQSREAEVTVPGGRIIDLPSGDVQVVERGPRTAPPIVLVHCFTCAIDWWDPMLPLLERNHRVIAVDLLGHGGSEKPDGGYTIEHQAESVHRALRALRIHDAAVVGHSLGGTVSVALAETAPDVVERVVILDTSTGRHDRGSLGFLAGLGFQPVIGEALWQLKPDFATKKGLEVAFAPGFDVPQEFVTDVNRMTYSAYDESPSASGDFVRERSLDLRMRATGMPLMVLMGSEEQIIDDPVQALAEYREAVPGVETHLIPGAGHSPNVEKAQRTAALILRFAQDHRMRFAQDHQKPVGSSVRDVTERGRESQQSTPTDVP